MYPLKPNVMPRQICQEMTSQAKDLIIAQSEQYNALKEIENEAVFKTSENKPDPFGGVLMWIAIAVAVIFLGWGIKKFV
ncbi:hypothetical protein HMPREF0765_1481 [Sphingobacterium spiritivorum ATCC 33300]|uniref:Uncharacterized protein n=1 Tax=Sphingobacterium spiritivorum ATCC 33300 TaxID=525372 RepID=C2FVX5_SPHSI|nr:hypothetical protein [Sphingobacterium spiritivorum]EEI92967.1 hypothetical protein HMPREF0765_1481 [Sphingobacterium spiritivorum ATCC 33300]QQS96309.1 hypothetical protein I6J03_00970 [Sphingobacterium spiritivorum]